MKTKRPWIFIKSVLPQHTDHAGVMWHGTYLNWLEESRIDSLLQAGINYFELVKINFEIPVIALEINYFSPCFLGDEITINSYYKFSNSPKLLIESEFLNKEKKILTKAAVYLTLIKKDKFSVARKRPEFIQNAFNKLNEGPN
tara:strand:- start:184 stop:612 length:429 start_codon:yes stop_codon:yes gene_type:complete